MNPVPDLGRLRTGHGFDVHRWSADPSRPLVLGGVLFTDSPGLVGHSDADPIAHAIIDAMLGAAGMGDIGQMFPDTSDTHAGANSVELLRSAAGKLRDHGWRLINVDCTVVCDAPRIAPERSRMEELLSQAAGGQVTIKGKRTEGVSGLGEGIRCHASALLVGP